ncbi:MAG: winged helix-turn-helix transcriptional regulator [Deltaproteobacteria bacterium]|nr:winged helix-turn-helix transcriptional regulator [Deltaproteobacteria bacterium]MBW1719151.1 winged helix-turn-helix transcriptional regulator [Deltaproteobacteria bacterium]MBW1932551.1 winged helix-turn-helix transcriptional regulator [Deltaproteobacteria bacterium]MBW1964999.1 winged helix-turn-helix transcriptional regulator [Deltaproteobacteria bacterium]MBW2079802.1 winged helix-turn-helix transcriptional regulator [Deltaproteobacteria bacterium]
MTRTKSRPYTVDDVRYIYKNYTNMTAVEIADELGISKAQVSKIVTELRRQGVDLPKKKRENPVEIFIREEPGLKLKHS